MKIGHLLKTIHENLLKILIYFGGVLFIFSVVSISVSVFTRYFFNFSFIGVLELSTYIVLYIGLISAPWILKQREHIQIDFLFDMLKGIYKRIAGSFLSFISAVLFLVLSWQGLKTSWDLYARGYFTDTMLEVPRYILVGIVTVSFIFLFIQYTIDSYRWLKGDYS